MDPSYPEILSTELDLKTALQKKRTDISARDGSVNLIFKNNFSALGDLI
jgi:hypothetical protein